MLKPTPEIVAVSYQEMKNQINREFDPWHQDERCEKDCLLSGGAVFSNNQLRAPIRQNGSGHNWIHGLYKGIHTCTYALTCLSVR